jgi:hypothetical protein
MGPRLFLSGYRPQNRDAHGEVVFWLVREFYLPKSASWMIEVISSGDFLIGSGSSSGEGRSVGRLTDLQRADPGALI